VLQTYVPRPFSGKVANFLAGDNQVSARALEDPRLGWRDFVRGPLHEHRVGGQHKTMFAEEYAPELSEHLRAFARAEFKTAPLPH
jgi:thioesterase domain-containing protein